MSLLLTTIETYNTRAIKTGIKLVASELELELLEGFIRHTGRPLPKVLVVGRRLAAQVSALEAIGADATGIDAAEAAVNAAAKAFPTLVFKTCDVREMDMPEYDGVWVEGLLSRVPSDEFDAVAAGLLNALHPGGLLRVSVRTGHQESTQETEHGPVVMREFDLKMLEESLRDLDCSLLGNVALGGNRVGLTFRKEY
ncbi:hypothetical protein OAU50_05390 [Planctomycetota bacterium]|nr:hypothetical protein [Planctomycetota bacterium]